MDLTITSSCTLFHALFSSIFQAFFIAFASPLLPCCSNSYPNPYCTYKPRCRRLLCQRHQTIAKRDSITSFLIRSLTFNTFPSQTTSPFRRSIVSSPHHHPFLLRPCHLPPTGSLLESACLGLGPLFYLFSYHHLFHIHTRLSSNSSLYIERWRTHMR